MTQQDYALRRVLYYVMSVGAGRQMRRRKLKYEEKEVVKLGMLSALRCLSDFLSDKASKPDDASIHDFGLSPYSAISEWAQISKLAAHPKKVRIDVFTDRMARRLGKETLEDAADFVRKCDSLKLARRVGNANKYLDAIRRTLRHLKL